MLFLDPKKLRKVLKGAVIGIDNFGESAPGAILMNHFGFTTENVIRVAKSVL